MKDETGDGWWLTKNDDDDNGVSDKNKKLKDSFDFRVATFLY